VQKLQEKKRTKGWLTARARVGRTCRLSALKGSCQWTYTGVFMPRQRNPATFSCDDVVVFGLPARHGLSPDIDIANPANGRDIPEMHLLDSVVTMFH
jgi:hypothetical protein